MSKLWSILDADNRGRIINLPNPQNSGDAVNKAYVDALVEGLNWKDDVRVATTSNINIASAPASIDGVTLAANDRVLVRAQTDAKENGIYIYNGAGNALTRSYDANTGSELTNAVVVVDEGATNAGTSWRQTTVNPVIGTDNIVWAEFGGAVPDASETTKGKLYIATQAEVDAGTNDSEAITPLKLANWSGRIRKYATTFGDTTNTTYTITHNLNSQDVVHSIRTTSDNKSVIASVTHTSANSLTVELAQAPGNNALRIVVVA